METARYEDAEGAFRLSLPDGWAVERDEEGGLLLSAADGIGLLHVVPFARADAAELDPAEELYAFLADQEIELEEDEVEDLDLEGGGALALCEYVEEDEDDEGATYWMVGVASGPAQLVFASYSCPMGEEEAEGEVVRGILKTLVFEEEEGEGEGEGEGKR